MSHKEYSKQSLIRHIEISLEINCLVVFEMLFKELLNRKWVYNPDIPGINELKPHLTFIIKTACDSRPVEFLIAIHKIITKRTAMKQNVCCDAYSIYMICFLKHAMLEGDQDRLSSIEAIVPDQYENMYHYILDQKFVIHPNIIKSVMKKLYDLIATNNPSKDVTASNIERIDVQNIDHVFEGQIPQIILETKLEQYSAFDTLLPMAKTMIVDSIEGFRVLTKGQVFNEPRVKAMIETCNKYGSQQIKNYLFYSYDL